MLEAERKPALRIVENGKRKVLRGEYSGRITKVNSELLQTLLVAGYVPVVAPLAISHQNEALNVDGDRAAAAIGAALRARLLVILSNVPGLLRDFPNESSLIKHVRAGDAPVVLEKYAQGRMKKKILGATEALESGVQRVMLADGRVAQPVRRALAGSGTVID